MPVDRRQLPTSCLDRDFGNGTAGREIDREMLLLCGLDLREGHAPLP